MEEGEKMKLLIKDGIIHDQVFIVFGEDYQRHPHALEHVLRPLFEKNRFIWVETIGLRSPRLSLYDFKRVLEKLGKFFFRAKGVSLKEKLPEDFIILTPFMIPFNQFSPVRKLNEWNVKRSIKNELERESSKIRPISITSVPNACDYIGHYNEILKVYYCVDEFSLWPGLDYSLVNKMETKLLQEVDLIIATSDALAASKKINNSITQVITHGVDFDFFQMPPLVKRNTPTKLCYFGLFDERFDQDLLCLFLKEMPKVEVHIFGNVVCETERLKSFWNVIFHGNVLYNELPLKIRQMDIFILPYVLNELTRNINPLKLKEYLGIGRPVIATKLPEVVKLSPYLNLISSADELRDLITKYEQEELPHSRSAVLQYVEDNETWGAKAKQLCELLAKRFEDPSQQA